MEDEGQVSPPNQFQIYQIPKQTNNQPSNMPPNPYAFSHQFSMPSPSLMGMNNMNPGGFRSISITMPMPPMPLNMFNFSQGIGGFLNRLLG